MSEPKELVAIVKDDSGDAVSEDKLTYPKETGEDVQDSKVSAGQNGFIAQPNWMQWVQS